jgi:hypothetical protein
MEAKNKALELYHKYFLLNESETINGSWNIIHLNHVLAKKCSLIVVNELIEEAYFTDGYYDRLDYWEEIKQEIENL